MTYSIGHVIYGYPMTEGKSEQELAKEYQDLEDHHVPKGFLSYYSGSNMNSYDPAAFGIKLCEIDDAVDFITVSELTLTPTDDQKRELAAYVEALRPEDKCIITNLDQPFVFILWSTS